LTKHFPEPGYYRIGFVDTKSSASSLLLLDYGKHNGLVTIDTIYREQNEGTPLVFNKVNVTGISDCKLPPNFWPIKSINFGLIDLVLAVLRKKVRSIS
jgi:hypothetical protein